MIWFLSTHARTHARTYVRAGVVWQWWLDVEVGDEDGCGTSGGKAEADPARCPLASPEGARTPQRTLQ